jgi:hypothetical protein
MEAYPDRWLLLEQASDRGDWCEGQGVYDHLILNDSVNQPKAGAPTGSPAEREICILFLPERYGGLALPDAYTNRFTWRWNVWCHYGRDISLADCPQRWQSYERLSEQDKAGLSRGGSQPPLPFSRGMPQPWSDCMNEFKDIVKDIVREPPSVTGGGSDQFNRCLDLLKRAWGLATGNQSTQSLLEQSREALPAVLAARYILDALPAHAGLDPQTRKATLVKSLALCRDSGLLAMAQRKEQFSDTMREAYRRVGFTVLYLQCLTKPAAQHQFRASDLEHLRRALRILLTTADVEAAITTKALMQHP